MLRTDITNWSQFSTLLMKIAFNEKIENLKAIFLHEHLLRLFLKLAFQFKAVVWSISKIIII